MARVELPVDVDLDVLRKQSDTRTEKRFRLQGHVFTVSPTLPLYAAMALAKRNGVQEFLRLWLGEKQEALLATLDIDEDELLQLVETLYGATSGESSASS